MNQEEFSANLQQAYQEALKGVDAITADAARIRREAEAELDAAEEIRKRAEVEGERMAEEYFAKAQVQLVEFTRRELLRTLARRHLEAGESAEAICRWLDVSEEFVAEIRAVLDRVARLYAPSVLPGNPSVRCSQEGRGGTVWFESARAKFSLWWEFAGEDALVIVEFPTPKAWTARTGLPLEEREAVACFIGEQLVAQRNGGRGVFRLGESVLTIYA